MARNSGNLEEDLPHLIFGNRPKMSGIIEAQAREGKYDCVRTSPEFGDLPVKSRITFPSLVLMAVLCGTGATRAAILEVYIPTGQPSNATLAGGQVAGSVFQAVNTVTFHSLGFIDLNDSFPTLGGPDGIHDSYQVGIWDYTSQVLLASATVTPASPLGSNFSQFRYAPISPVTVTAGQYFIVGALLPANPLDAWLINGVNVDSTDFTGPGAGRYLAGTTLSYPTDPTALASLPLAGTPYAVANASTEVVPEVSSGGMVCIALSLGCIGMYWQRNRRAISIR